MSSIYDLIIIGAGPAGITASVYAARKRMNFLVISKDIGGQTAWSGDIENYTGYQFISGLELTGKFEEHMKKYGVEVREGEEARGIEKQSNLISVTTNKGTHRAKTVIIASGKRSRELGVPGEKEFKNKGVAYCATCDAPVFAGKDVAVIGSGNSGLEAVLQLIKIAKHIYLIDVTPSLNGDEILQEKIKASEKVTILLTTQVTAITGEAVVDGLTVATDNQKKEIPLQGVFIEIGLRPNTEFAAPLEKNKRGEIKVDSYNRTNIPGIFAAGDVTDVPEKQIVIAAGEGAKAALAAFRYLIQQK